MGSNTVYYKPTFSNISEEKRTKILTVAVNEFANNGFNNANINTIAKKAEVSVGSLYKYFDTKTDLFLTSVNFGISNLEAVLESVINSAEEVMVKLEKLIRIAIEFSRKSGVLIKLYNEFTGENDPELAKKIARSMEPVTAAAYKKAIVEGQVNGEIRTDLDPGMAAYLVDNILINVQFSYACDYYSERYRIYAGEDVFEKDEFVIENILRFIKAALKMNENP